MPLILSTVVLVQSVVVGAKGAALIASDLARAAAGVPKAVPQEAA